MQQMAFNLIEENLSLGAHKSVSYLPLKALRLHGIPLENFVDAAESRQLGIIVIDGKDSWLRSAEGWDGGGIVYAFCRSELNKLIEDYRSVLVENSWPVDIESFIRKLATGWLDEDHPVLPVVRDAFGDPDRI